MNRARQYRYFDIIMAVFVTVLVVSNIASSAKIVDLGFSIFGVRMAFDGGTLLFPLSYIFGDILTEVYGYKNSRRVIWAGFACLALSAVVFALVKIMPGEAQWEKYAGDAAYLAILGGMSSGGIVLASLAGYWSGEFSNSFVLAKMKILTQRPLVMDTHHRQYYCGRTGGYGCVCDDRFTLQGFSMEPVRDVVFNQLFVQVRS